jgi:hypothetical protein
MNEPDRSAKCPHFSLAQRGSSTHESHQASVTEPSIRFNTTPTDSNKRCFQAIDHSTPALPIQPHDATVDDELSNKRHTNSELPSNVTASSASANAATRPALIGYARVSKWQQKLDLQRDALVSARCHRCHRCSRISCVANLVVGRLDRLGPATHQLAVPEKNAFHIGPGFSLLEVVLAIRLFLRHRRFLTTSLPN